MSGFTSSKGWVQMDLPCLFIRHPLELNCLIFLVVVQRTVLPEMLALLISISCHLPMGNYPVSKNNAKNKEGKGERPMSGLAFTKEKTLFSFSVMRASYTGLHRTLQSA